MLMPDFDVLLINCEEIACEVIGVEREILEREGCFHSHEEWNLGFQRE
jgi:hypothetical protein